MFERANYYQSRFIRNGIAGLLMSVFIIYISIAKDKVFPPITIALPIVAFAWLYFGLRIKNKLKTKVATNEIIDERISFKQVEYAFSILVFVSLLLSFRHWQYANYLVIVALLAYTSWFSIQMKLLNDYFNSK